jgi:alpha-D-ribose 1-methylphosphonate 5-triphosphate synthase subunit PhnH
MKLDLVHDIQKSYRKVLNCMARPGVIESIKEVSEKVDMNIDFLKSTLVIMFMLLDAEVSFKIISKNERDLTNIVNQLTYAKASDAEAADFVFVLRDAAPEDIELAFRDAKLGDLIDPHKSATIIVEVDEVSNEKALALKGPGIEEINYVKITALGNWIEAREQKNIEYPLGVDTIFIDKGSNILCLPRTTQIFNKHTKLHLNK